MAQPYHNSTSLYEEQHCHLFNFDQTFSSLSLSCPVFVNDHHPPQVQGHSYFIEAPQHFQLQLQADQMVPFVDQSCDLLSATTADENQSDHQYHDSLKLNSWKSSDELIERNEILNDGTDHHENIINSPNKWKMMKYPTDQITSSDMPAVNYTTHKFENTKKYPISPLPATAQINNNSSFTSSGNNNTTTTTTTTTTTIRVCVDCSTTKTPLWRSGPRGPKTLCNACGIRQRKARRAMAAAAGSGTIITVDKSSKKGRSSTVQKKESKAIKNKNNNISCLPFKKRCKLNSPSTRGRKKNQVGSNFEELAIRINKNISAYQLSVFPQDEKEAAILLMALSYGLVNG